MPLLIIDTVARRARGVVTAAGDGCVRGIPTRIAAQGDNVSGLVVFVCACVRMSTFVCLSVCMYVLMCLYLYPCLSVTGEFMLSCFGIYRGRSSSHRSGVQCSRGPCGTT